MSIKMPLRNITIYYKENDTWKRIVLKASFRNTSIQNRLRTGLKTIDNALIRIFDISNYSKTWTIHQNDIIVDEAVTDDLSTSTTPATTLKNKYGNTHVFQVNSIDENIFGTSLDHIKIGAI